MARSFEQLEPKEKENLVRQVLDKKNGLDDTDWCDIVDDFGLDCSPDTLRKAGVGVKLASDAGMGFGTGVSVWDEMDGYAERQKLCDLRRDIRKELREQSRSELLRETIRDAVAKLPEIRVADIRVIDPDEAECDLVVGLGDFHYGASFCVNGLYGETINEYNSAVFERRMAELAGHILWVADRHQVDAIHLMMVGDLLDGMLRAGQLQRLEFGVVESAMRLSEFLCQWIGNLSRETRVPIRVCAVRGNHGEIRPLGSKAGQFPEENLERVVMHYLFMRFLEEPMVIIENDDAPMTQAVTVCGYQFLLIHGQGADIETIARDHQNLYGRPIDVFLCGHLHKSQTFTAGMSGKGNAVIERVPSLCGMDPYAQSRGFGSPPGATIIVMEKGYGRRCVYPITLT